MYLFYSAICSIMERSLRSIIWINSLDQVMTDPQVSFAQMGKHFIISGGLLFIRYLICSKRHIWAYHSGFQERNTRLAGIQREWLQADASRTQNRNEVFKMTQDIRELGHLIAESHARIAIDLVPGIVSVVIGCLQLIRYIDCPVSYYSILYIIGLEYIYTLSVKYQNQKDTQATLLVRDTQSRMFACAAESIQNKELVLSLGRVAYELDIFKSLCWVSFSNEMERTRIFNWISSMTHWMSQLVYIGILIITRPYIDQKTHMLWILYFTKEIRNGFQEIYHYFKRIRHRVELYLSIQDKIVNTSNTSKITIGNKIKINSLSYRYGDEKVIDNLSFSEDVFNSNRYTIIMGKNGSGKSTLCKILSGCITDIEIAKHGCFMRPESNNCLVCEQHPQVFESQSVLYNIAYGTDDIYQKRYLDNQGFYRDISQYLDMESFIDHDTLVSSLSGGERQKVCLLRAYVRSIQCQDDIKFLILDEWDSALDLYSRQIGFRLIEEIVESTHCRVIWVSHTEIPNLLDSEHAMGLILDSGKNHVYGRYSEMWNKYSDIDNT